MSHPDPDDHPDTERARRMWEQFAASRPPAGPCPAAGDLAAFVDGRLAPAERTALEGHLAACADCLATVREARAILAEGSPRTAPASVMAAARSLVPPEVAAAPVTGPAVGPASGWRIADWLSAGRWIAATAASLAICLVGYRAGTMSFISEGVANDPLAANMSFGVFDDAEDDDDLVLLGVASDWAEVSP